MKKYRYTERERERERKRYDREREREREIERERERNGLETILVSWSHALLDPRILKRRCTASAIAQKASWYKLKACFAFPALLLREIVYRINNKQLRRSFLVRVAIKQLAAVI